ARALDMRNPLVRIKPGVSNPVVRVPLWELAARDGPGAPLGSTISVTYRGKSIAVTQPTSVIASDGWASFRIPIKKAVRNGLYVAYLKIGDANGNSAQPVVEHLPDLDSQTAFVGELCRVACRVFLTTPNRWFPVDTHTLVPLAHWLPDERRDAVYRRLGREEGLGLRLLSPSDLLALFPVSVRPRL